MRNLKTCACGAEHKDLPPTTKYHSDDAFAGFYFNCQCGSTLFVPEALEKARVEALLNEARKSPAVAHAEVTYAKDIQPHYFLSLQRRLGRA
jgi:hypothetical protein